MKGTPPFLLCLVVVISGAWAHAVELVGSPEVSASATGATVHWTTDIPCGTRLSYGLNAAQLNQKAEGTVTADHTITLGSLSAGTTYYYSLGSARQQLATGTFTTSGNAPAANPAPSIVRRLLDVITPEKKPAPKAAIPAQAPPARQTWANLASLQDHFDRHGRDFSSTSPEDYAAQAWRFLQRARDGSLQMKLDATDGTVRIFDPKTRAFAAFNESGRTKTFFKPESPSYWQRQPGRPVKPADLRFFSR